jgi:hypothetical protein
MAAMLFSGSVPRKIPQRKITRTARMKTIFQVRFFMVETAT